MQIIMADKTWKKFERRVAAFFGTERTALSGGNSKLTRSDSLHPDLFIEAKQRKRFAVVRLWDATKRLADKEKKTPVVCVSEKGRAGFWILVHSDDLLKIQTQATAPQLSASSANSAVNPSAIQGIH